MNIKSTKTGLFGLVILLGLQSTNVMATNGYFAIGYGARNVGIGGATVSAPQDALAASTNPAGIGLLEDRTDLGIRLFSPIREAKLDPTVFGGSFMVEDESIRDFFLIPNFGITRKYNDDLTFGLSVYGNGGMNTTYKRNIYDESAAVLGAFAFAGGGAAGAAAAAGVPPGTGTGSPHTGTLGVDLAQAIIAPSISFKIHPKHHIGISALIGIQVFEARGLGNFHCFTPSAVAANPVACAPGGFGPAAPGFIPSTKLTNNGHEWSYGMGVRVGWVGEISPKVTVGAAVASKIYMTEFDDYSELFAEDGDFDIPANITFGISFTPTDQWLLAFDYQRIFYGDIAAVSNAGPVVSPAGPSIPAGSGLLGSDNGLGFGWESINVFKFGAKYQHNAHWTYRVGYNYNESPIPDSQLLFNILAPAVNEHHFTLGFSYAPNKSNEWNFAYMHALDNSQDSPLTAFGTPGEIGMFQNSLELSYSWKF